MDQKAADELVGVERHELVAGVVFGPQDGLGRVDVAAGNRASLQSSTAKKFFNTCRDARRSAVGMVEAPWISHAAPSAGAAWRAVRPLPPDSAAAPGAARRDNRGGRDSGDYAIEQPPVRGQRLADPGEVLAAPYPLDGGKLAVLQAELTVLPV